MTGRQHRKPELLAPAGSTSVFERAVEAGADAVYIGAPGLNARALSRDFTPAEIGAMISYAHRKGVKLYLAANSLLKEDEIPQAVEMLALLETLEPDGLIIQDLGLYHLCRKYFPSLRLHASTLFGAHNSLAVRQFTNMGFKRVVLARELTIKEIGAIAGSTDVELEVFIHGALCFSYSGLCQFSSYLGGKSGLRGRCVQPCRRRYRWQQQGERPGYFFSMNDLSSIDLIGRLTGAGVSSLKIEGRLRSAHYVSSVVRAYRMVIDADPGDKKVLEEAEELLGQAMGRKTSRGYFNTAQAEDLITPYHSGNIGLYLGQAARGSGRGKMLLSLKQPLQVGDRLRLHQEQTGERVSFNLQHLKIKNSKAVRAERGEHILIDTPVTVREGDSLFKVDSRRAREIEKKQTGLHPDVFKPIVGKIQEKARQKAATLIKSLSSGRSGAGKKPIRKMRRSGAAAGSTLPLYIKINDLQVLKYRLPLMPELLLVELNRQTYKAFQQQRKAVKKFLHKLAWSLPPVIVEGEVDFFRSAVVQLVKNNFRTWQIGHIGQLQLFSGLQQLNLLGDYTLNILNSQGLNVLNSFGLQRAQVAIETDRDNLQNLLGSKSTFKSRLAPGMTVYGQPPLFIARPVAPHFLYEQPFVSPKGETFILHKSWDSTVAMAENPFSLLPKLAELAGMGLKYAVIDLSRRKLTKSASGEITRELSGRGARRKLSTFNFDGTLL